jgi:uncharacterized membrane protein
MDIYLIILRIIHFFAGIYWVGAGIFLVTMLTPALKNMGTEGESSVMRHLYMDTMYTMSFPAASILTTVAGILLFWEVSDHFNSDWMGNATGVVLSIGGLAGVLAFGHGAGALGPITNKHKALLTATADGATPEQLTEIAALNEKIVMHGKISLGLMIVAVVCMASARYA